jgi:DNA-binding XRE family transcriptional regulator
MKMKDQLESAQPMKKHKAKSKKNELKKKKQEKLEAKKHSKEKKADKPKAAETNTHITPSIVDQKSRLKQAESLDAETSNNNRQRASKSLTPMTKEEQLIAINLIIKRLLMDEITQGAALRELRVGVLGLRQDAYTELTGVSRKTLSEIENDKGNYTAEIINKVFKPFDLKVGLVPTSSQLLSAILIH